MGALPPPPYSALPNAAPPLPRPPPPAVNECRRAGHAGSWSPCARVPAEAHGGMTTIPVRPRAAGRPGAARGWAGVGGGERAESVTTPALSAPPGHARVAQPSGSCSWVEGPGRREAPSPAVDELQDWRRGVPPH